MLSKQTHMGKTSVDVESQQARKFYDVQSPDSGIASSGFSVPIGWIWSNAQT